MAVQSSDLFRKKALDRIASPEQLDDYLRVTNPGVWTLLAAVICLLAGLCVWSTVGSLETVVDGVAIVENGQATITVGDSAGIQIQAGMTVRASDGEFAVSAVEKDDYGRAVGLSPTNLANGRYDVKIVTENIHPIEFLLG